MRGLTHPVKKAGQGRTIARLGGAVSGLLDWVFGGLG